MNSRVLRAIGGWSAALLLLLICVEAPAAQQIMVREIISPRTDTLTVEDMFEGMGGGDIREVSAAGDVSAAGEASAAGRQRFFGRRSLSSGGEPFGPDPAYIPFWQMMQLFRNFFPTREEGALVGGGAYYLPPEMTETRKHLALSILRKAREENDIGEQLRLELRLSDIPNVLIDGAIDGNQESLRVERISRNAGGGRFAVYTNGGHPKAVVSAEFRYYAPGYRAAREIEEGTELDSSMIYGSAVEIPLSSLSRNGDGQRRRDRRNPSGGFSLEGLKDGYRYTLREHVRQGEELEGSLLDVKAPVEGGERVECFFRRGQLRLKIEGRALSSGAIGDTVRVRLSSGKLREMRVLGRGKVEYEGARG